MTVFVLNSFFIRKKCSKAEQTELIEKVLTLIAGHSHEVSILCQAHVKKGTGIFLGYRWFQGGGVVPYVSHIGTCTMYVQPQFKGYGFCQSCFGLK